MWPAQKKGTNIENLIFGNTYLKVLQIFKISLKKIEKLGI